MRMTTSDAVAIKVRIHAFSDEKLERELAFAEAFGDTRAPNAKLWLSELQKEAKRRWSGKQ